MKTKHIPIEFEHQQSERNKILRIKTQPRPAIIMDDEDAHKSDTEKLKARIAKLETTLKCVVGLIGNVDHSKGNGANSAKMRGDLLNDLRTISSEALKEPL